MTTIVRQLRVSQLIFIAPSSPVALRTLIDAVKEYSLELCCTASGNHLCQQLLERVDTADKLDFLQPVMCVSSTTQAATTADAPSENLIFISNSKFGTHVLNRAASIKELEV